MTPSVAELQAQLLKAARASGLALGVAEDIAAAAPYLMGMDNPNEALSALLEGMRSARITHVISAIDAAIAGKPAEVADSPAARALVAAAAHRTQRALVLSGGRVQDRGAAKIAPAIPRRKPVDAAIWNDLSALAAKTYVPSSAQSRAKGAGAGESD